MEPWQYSPGLLTPFLVLTGKVGATKISGQWSSSKLLSMKERKMHGPSLRFWIPSLADFLWTFHIFPLCPLSRTMRGDTRMTSSLHGPVHCFFSCSATEPLRTPLDGTRKQFDRRPVFGSNEARSQFRAGGGGRFLYTHQHFEGSVLR